MRINWKRKLTSRKFWAAVAGFITPLIIAFGGSAEITAQIVALVMSGACVVAYIVGESAADCARGKTPACSPRLGLIPEEPKA